VKIGVKIWGEVGERMGEMWDREIEVGDIRGRRG
jgi:hypothetical protein